MSEPRLTKREIAAKLKVSTRTVERLRLPFMRAGGQNRYQLTEAEDALRSIRGPQTSVLVRPQQNADNVVEFPGRKVPA